MPATVLLASAPLLWMHAREMMSQELYDYFIFIPIGAAFLAWQRLPGLGQLVPGNALVFAALMAVGGGTLAFAVAIFSPWFAMIAALIVTLGMLYGVGGGRVLARMLPVWLFLWFMVPLPFDLGETLVTSLQSVTAVWSSRLLDTFGIMHLMTGNTVELPGNHLFVDEACSGVHSLFACVAATAFFVIWSRYRLVRSLLLLAAAFGWVLVDNAMRVVLITWCTTLNI
ncbi:MAG TPA: exosortase/archaeosortase family protein, partial [Pirellulales bacterium]|nr:exosortase/archaeosortase family protein [Pirellulales bacterium]